MEKKKVLWLCDADGSLATSYDTTILPGVKEWVSTLDPDNDCVAIVSNQGGVGLRYWIESSGGFGKTDAEKQRSLQDARRYPTQEMASNRLIAIKDELFDYRFHCLIYYCCRFLSRAGNWCPTPFDHLARPTVAELIAVADNENDSQEVLSAPDEDKLPFAWRKENRKPNPGMLLSAINFAVNLFGLFDRIVMIGNSEDDQGAARAAGVEYLDADDFFSKTVTIIAHVDHPTAWLRQKALAGLDKAATNKRYEAMLVDQATRHERTKAKVVWEPGNGTESFSGCDSWMEDSIRRSIKDEWINSSWLVYDSPKAHVDALFAGRHIQQLVIVSSEIAAVYGAEALREIGPYLDEIRDEYHKHYRFELVALPVDSD